MPKQPVHSLYDLPLVLAAIVIIVLMPLVLELAELHTVYAIDQLPPRELNKLLVNRNKVFQKETGSKKDRLRDELSAVAKVRKAKIVEIAEKKPKEALKLILSDADF